jgi:serine/threonine protein kinase
MLAAGAKLGPYEVLEAIGAGGMGEVYKARDTRLDRVVAIKVLPNRLATNTMFRTRFLREARTLSSMAHPNICALYDIGEADGTTFIVMEYLEGETLADRLLHGAMPLAEILAVAMETAEGLASAHQRNVAHRDLKPANIMLTKSGVKLLDFGLARDVSTAVAVDGESSSPATEGPPLTTPNAIIGTFQYMSPEQITGREADHRSDVFAYGAVLYEMVTRRRAFGERSQANVIASVLERAPVSVRALRPEAPHSIEAVINRCLEKDPTRRWQCMADLINELRHIAALPGERRRLAPPPRRSYRIERAGWALAVLVLAVTVLVLLLTRTPAPTVRMHASALPPEKAQFEFTGDRGGPAVISSDGQKLAFAAVSAYGDSRLFIRDFTAGTTREIAGTSHATFPFWSADSRSVGFFADGKLRTVDISAGASPQTLCPVMEARGGTWSSAGDILFAPNSHGGLVRVSDAGGKPEAVTRVDEPRYSTHRWPFFLPDGKHFLYSAAHHARPEEGSCIFFASLDGKTNKLLLHTEGHAAYAAGYLLFVNGPELWARRFDPSTGEFLADAATLASEVLYDQGIWRGIFSASDSGVLVYQPGGLAGLKSRLTWVDRGGRPIGAAGEAFVQFSVRISRTGKYAVVDGSTPAPGVQAAVGADIWIVELDTGTRRRLTNTTDVSSPAWSPDGKWVAYTRTARTGQQGIYRKPAEGAAAEELLLPTTMPTWVADWSPDGQFLLFMQDAGLTKTRRDLWLLPLNGGAARPLLQNPDDETNGAISPDGHWLAYVSDENNRREIYVASFPSLAHRLAVSMAGGSTVGGSTPRWSPNGKELFFVGPDSTMYSAQLRPRAGTLEVLKITPLFRTKLKSIFQGAAYGVSPDGQRFLVNTPAEDPNRPLALIQNWPLGAKQ